MKYNTKKLCAILCAICMLFMFSCTNDAAPAYEKSAVSESVSKETVFSKETASLQEKTEEESEEKSEESSEIDESIYDYSDFTPIIRFAVCSDTHISATSDDSAKRFKKLFESAYKYAEGEEYNKLDAVVVVGDMTNYGMAYEYTAFKSIVSDSIKEETMLITMLGNHEFYVGKEKVYLENMDYGLNNDTVINGFHFISVSPSGDNEYSSETIKFLREAVKAAEEEDAEKPIFCFQHHHMANTVYVSKTWYAEDTSKFVTIFNRHSQIVDFSGHSHGPINNPTSIWQGTYTALGTGTLSYFEMETGMTYGTIPPNSSDAAQYYIVEVDARNRVVIKPYNILTDSFFKTPSNTDEEDAEMTWYIDIPSNPQTFRYKKRTSENPYFKEDAEVTVLNNTKSMALIEFPQAYDDDCIYSYRIVYWTDGGKKTEVNYFSEYYFEPLKETVKVNLTKLTAGTKYNVTVYPCDCFGNEGEPINGEFTTKE